MEDENKMPEDIRLAKIAELETRARVERERFIAETEYDLVTAINTLVKLHGNKESVNALVADAIEKAAIF